MKFTTLWNLKYIRQSASIKKFQFNFKGLYKKMSYFFNLSFSLLMLFLNVVFAEKDNSENEDCSWKYWHCSMM